MSRIDDIIEHSRKRERELTDMAERLLVGHQNATIMEIAKERDQLRAELEEARMLLAQALDAGVPVGLREAINDYLIRDSTPQEGDESHG